MQPIRSFVVRIYRQERGGMDGVVEDVKSGRSRPFHSIVELWEAMRARPKRGRKDPPPHPAGVPEPAASEVGGTHPAGTTQAGTTPARTAPAESSTD